MNGNYEIKLLNAERWNDLASLFKTSKACKDCWCFNHRVPYQKALVKNAARDAMKGLVKEGKVTGLLAYEGETAVGWCAVDPLASQTGHDYFSFTKGPVDPTTWILHCLYVAPTHRGKGISTQLIESAITHAKTSGGTELLAFPIPDDSQKKFALHDTEFSGRLGTYLRLGFLKQERLTEFYQKVRLDLLAERVRMEEAPNNIQFKLL
jgi:GNAT superfamily N-acetyltransferase